MGKGTISFRDADGLFRQAMRELGTPFLRRWIMWASVRWAAAKRGGLSRDWWIEFPRMLVVTLIMLPIVAPAAIVIAITIVVLYVLEMLTWLLLQLGKVVGRAVRFERPEKPVNMPRLSFKV